MKRRDFIKGALLATVAISSGKTFAGEYGEKSMKDINRLTNRDNPSVLEQKHVPSVEAPDMAESGQWFDVKVNVGFMEEHPSTPGHWITMIKLLADGKEVSKSEFERGGISAPEAKFRIRLDKSAKLEAIEHCNLHGTWISDPLNIKIT